MTLSADLSPLISELGPRLFLILNLPGDKFVSDYFVLFCNVRPCYIRLSLTPVNFNLTPQRGRAVAIC